MFQNPGIDLFSNERKDKKVKELEQRMEKMETKIESKQVGNWEGITKKVSGVETEIER